MVVGIIPGLIVGLREGVEGALIIGIILAYLTKIGQKPLHRYVFAGTGAAIAGSLGVAGVIALLHVEFEGTGEQLFEGIAAILAVVVLTSMVLWMMRAAKDIRRHVEQRIEVLVDRRQVMGLVSLAFIAVFREGVETVLFMAGLTTTIATADVVAGAAIGLVIAAFLGYGLFAASWKINLPRFFQATGLLLIIIAAGLFALGLHELQEAGVLPWLPGEVYNLKATFADTQANPAGYILRGLVGYNDNPTQLEALGYAGYWVFAGVLYQAIRTGKIEVVTRPIRRLWALIRRTPEPSPAEPRAG